MHSACCQKCVIERGDCRRVVFHPVLALRVLGRIFRGLCDDSYVLETLCNYFGFSSAEV